MKQDINIDNHMILQILTILDKNMSLLLLLDLFCILLQTVHLLLLLFQYLFGKAHSSARGRWILKGNFPGAFL